jgi:hypothetical protein
MADMADTLEHEHEHEHAHTYKAILQLASPDLGIARYLSLKALLASFGNKVFEPHSIILTLDDYLFKKLDLTSTRKTYSHRYFPLN